MGGLGERKHAKLVDEADAKLWDADSLLLSELLHRFKVDQLAGRKRRISFDQDPLLLAEGDDVFFDMADVARDLVDRGNDAGFLDDALQVLDVEVRDADRFDLARLLGFFHHLEDLGVFLFVTVRFVGIPHLAPRFGGMDEHEVEIIDAQAG